MPIIRHLSFFNAWVQQIHCTVDWINTHSSFLHTALIFVAEKASGRSKKYWDHSVEHILTSVDSEIPNRLLCMMTGGGRFGRCCLSDDSSSPFSSNTSNMLQSYCLCPRVSVCGLAWLLCRAYSGSGSGWSDCVFKVIGDKVCWKQIVLGQMNFLFNHV